jgi:phosphohistidine phosphatase SixA
LKEAVPRAYGCELLYVNTVLVSPAVRTAQAFHGLIQIFELIGHEKAKRCYAWRFPDGRESAR